MQATTVLVGLGILTSIVHGALQTHVTLVVDGRLQTLGTTSTNVRDLLSGEGISLTADLLVDPSPATPLADGMTVVVSPAPDTAPDLLAATPSDPSSVGVWVVAGTSQQFVSPDADRFVESSVSASSAGTSPAVSVRAVVSGKVHDVLTNAGTAGALLSAMGITPDADDRVQPPPSTPLYDGATVRYDRVEVLTRLEAVTIHAPVSITYSDRMVPGTRRVLSLGAPGVGRATYQVTVMNGRQVAKTSDRPMDRGGADAQAHRVRARVHVRRHDRGARGDGTSPERAGDVVRPAMVRPHRGPSFTAVRHARDGDGPRQRPLRYGGHR